MPSSSVSITTIQNPILPGFNPDPSIIRVDNDYYIATSTFEWFPGVQIHHSRDLKHWRLLTHPLSRRSQLDMVGNPDSGGVWAPCLSYDDGIFYLVYSDVKSLHNGTHKVVHNYLATAESIKGPWSEPIFLNSSGFDPSLFHDEDGRKWITNLVWDFRKKETDQFGGILLQEYNPETQLLEGSVKKIFDGSDLKYTEGPHLYRRNGYYYLMTAEGGTSYGHACSMARSKSIEGPYKVDPENPFISSREFPSNPLQKCGHGSIVSTPNDEWYAVFLVGRPVGENRSCILGRETAIQKCNWTDDGWLRREGDGPAPSIETPSPNLEEHPFPELPARDNFETEELSIHFQSLRQPFDPSWISLSDRPGKLRLYGNEALVSPFRQSLVGRRLQSRNAEGSTYLEFNPENYLQMAGLSAYLHTRGHYYAHITWHEDFGKCIQLSGTDNGEYQEHLKDPIPLGDAQGVYLKVEFQEKTLQFYYSLDGEQWIALGPSLDATILSDEYGELYFTGTFICLCAQDISGQRLHADFDWFEYRELS